jgi:hypothetical protein
VGEAVVIPPSQPHWTVVGRIADDDRVKLGAAR